MLFDTLFIFVYILLSMIHFNLHDFFYLRNLKKKHIQTKTSDKELPVHAWTKRVPLFFVNSAKRVTDMDNHRG